MTTFFKKEKKAQKISKGKKFSLGLREFTLWHKVGKWAKREPYLGVVTKPPEVGKCACLTGPNYCSDVDILIPDGNKRDTQMDVLYRTCRKKQFIIRGFEVNPLHSIVNTKDLSFK